MRLIWAILLVSRIASAESVYVVQSHEITTVYGDTVVRELIRLRPNDDFQVLFLRDFRHDRFSQSRSLTAARIAERSGSHANLVLIGREALNLEIEATSIIKVAILAGDEGYSAPASLEHSTDVLDRMLDAYTDIDGMIYVFNDATDLSQIRYRRFREAMRAHREYKVVPVSVRTTLDLRKKMVEIGSLGNTRALSRHILVNNLFDLYDPDSLSDLSVRDIGLVFASLNRRHVELGVLCPGMSTAVSFGLSPQKIADHIDKEIEFGPTDELKPEIGINLSRVAELGLHEFVLQNHDLIERVEAPTR